MAHAAPATVEEIPEHPVLGGLGALLLLAVLAGVTQLAVQRTDWAGAAKPWTLPAPAAAAAPERSIEEEIALLRRLGGQGGQGGQGAQGSEGGAALLEARLAELKAAVVQDPRNARAWVLLGLMHADATRYAESAKAFEQALATSPKVALDPAVWCEYADVLGMAQGTLVGKPTEAIQKALALKSDHPKALEMAGSAAYERRDFASAADFWSRLLPKFEAGTEAHGQLSAAIERARRQASVSLPAQR
jgi:tetratricopeptide (TPR) repeat protein